LTTVDELLKNFPFPNLRESQFHVLNEIANALASDYKYIILEAPTGFGKRQTKRDKETKLSRNTLTVQNQQFLSHHHYIRVLI
jgi:superfamily II DNA or RNA helicase